MLRDVIPSTEALISHLKLEIEKLRRQHYGSRSERKAWLLEQMREIAARQTCICPSTRGRNTGKGALLRLWERSAWPELSARPHSIGIAANRSKDTPPVG
jgi:hypothetical protein